ncbi:MAG: cytochrome-c peroxidase [Chitinophagaceae bacterium]|nr:MAG: cytochrome-c peroxidase [Chitinophagaceae bacterium]
MSKKLWMTSAVLFLLLSCSKEILQRFPGFQAPADFPATAYHFDTNPVTQEGFELGRKLFYDPHLSRNNSISCGSCHIQSSAFTQHGHDLSHGVDDRLGKRNSPPIMNLAWMPLFLWDGGVFDLDLQPVVPITSHEEMDESVGNVIKKLQGIPAYPELFRKAFGSEEITTANMMKALSQFMVMCVSDQSKYDSVRRNQATFTPEEQAGYSFFRQSCTGCHKEPLLTDFSFRNNGIRAGLNGDRGRSGITLNPDDDFRFKVPSLRNVAYTAPYMHDGRFITLDAVLDHYAAKVQEAPTLDPLLRSGTTLGIPMTDVQKTQVIAFLKTLSDPQFIKNPILAEQ